MFAEGTSGEGTSCWANNQRGACFSLDALSDLLINLLASAVWAVLATLGALLLLPRYRRWALQRFWGFADEDVRVVVAATPSIDCDFRTQTNSCYWSVEHGPIIGYGDATALGHLMGAVRLASESLQFSFVLSTLIPPDIREHNLILIGGPAYNPLVGEIMNRVNTPVSFEGYSVRELRGANSLLHTPAITDGLITKDYGIILKTRNPFNSEKGVFIVAGCHDPGSIAAARYAMTALLKMRKRPESFALVVESEVLDNFYVGIPKLVSEIHPIPEVLEATTE